MTFLPEDYEVPQADSGYMKFEQGENRIRVLSSAIVGWEGWKDKKPIRKRLDEKISLSEVDDETKVKHFWAFIVWNYNAKKVQILEITQKGIMKSIRALTKDEDWGDPKQYDIVITREGESLDTEYQVQPKPKKKADEGMLKFYKELNINLDALFDGGDPFKSEEEYDVPEEDF